MSSHSRSRNKTYRQFEQDVAAYQEQLEALKVILDECVIGFEIKITEGELAVGALKIIRNELNSPYDWRQNDPKLSEPQN